MEPEHFLLPPSDPVPNNPWLPVLIYHSVLPDRTSDPAAMLEGLFARNGWPAQWRNGIFPYHHYHPDAHEVLGIARGRTDVLLGGPEGRRVAIMEGDVLVLPAGTGHRNMSPGSDLLVIGAYPPGVHWSTRRDMLSSEGVQRMRHVPFPLSDPVAGPNGPLPRLWTTG